MNESGLNHGWGGGVFELQRFRQTGVQVVQDFFEPEIRERFAALGKQIGDAVRRGQAQRSAQFLGGIDVEAASHISDSPALCAAVQEILGPNVCWQVSRVLMKDKTFTGAVDAHQDWPYFGGDTRKLNVFVPLTRCGPSNGMLVFYEGSHTLGPVERGAIDVERFPQFTPVCPQLEVGDVMFADFLTWHSSIPAEVDDDRILLQVVLQPASDRSSNMVFGEGWKNLGTVNQNRWSAMKAAMPTIGISVARQLLQAGDLDDAFRVARGIAYDSECNVEALLVLHAIDLARGSNSMEFLDAAEEANSKLGQRLAELRLRSPPPPADPRVVQLEAELAGLRASTSWRVTAPLRKFKQMVSAK